MKPAPIARPTLASFLEAYGPAKGARLWAFLVALSLVGRERLQEMGVHRTAISKNLLELTTHPALRGTKLTGHHVRGRTPRQLVEDFVADLVEASYQGQIAYRDFIELRQVLSAQADGLEEALRRRATFGALRVVLQDPKPARGKQKAKTVKEAVPARENRPPAERAAPLPSASAPAKKQRKKQATPYLGSGYCELCTHMWPNDWKPALTGRGQFRCLGCKQVLDVGLRMEPTRAGMKPIPRPADYRREELKPLTSADQQRK
jgi:hypothetical protein